MRPPPDGPLDRRIDISHLSQAQRKNRQEKYEKWKVPEGTITTAAGTVLDFDLGRDDGNARFARMQWKVNGKVSVAKVSCQTCAEINSCRKKGTPPWICLLKVYDQYGRIDEASKCAICFCDGKQIPCDAVRFSINDQSGSINRSTSEETSSELTDLSDEDEETEESEESEVEIVDHLTTKSGRVIRPVGRYNDAENSVCNSTTANVPSSSQRVNNVASDRHHPDKSSSSTDSRPAKQQKRDGDAPSRKAVNSERARQIRRDCIKTAKQLLSLQTALLEAELEEE